MRKMHVVLASLFFVVMAGCQDDMKTETVAQPVSEIQAAPPAPPARPSDAELHAYKAYHHARYMVQTADAVGGTNKLLHTKSLPTEGTDAVVSPALDHIYSKAVIDLTEGPVTVDIPEGIDDRYWSIHVTDQEHYTIYDEVHPVGKYTFVRKGKDIQVPEGATVIECQEDYPHLFIRIQVKTEDELDNISAIQEMISLEGVSKPLAIDNYIVFTLATHDIHEPNKGILDTVKDFNEEDYNRVTQYLGAVAPSFPDTSGMFGPIDSQEAGSDNPAIRAAAIFGHLGLPAMHAIYIPHFTNCQQQRLSGDNVEVFSFAYEPEGVKDFWSVTRYSLLTRNTISGKNDVFNAYNTTPDGDGNITITFSAEDPKDGTYWMPVNNGDPYYFIARYYNADLGNLPKTCK
ncbi:MAG: DUF1254 domain-containing protein [Amphritea sp.]